MAGLQKNFIVIDGIELVGKGTALLALEQWARERGMRILNTLAEGGASISQLPKYSDLQKANFADQFDVIISHEPTDYGVGDAIRNEYIRKEVRAEPYDDLAIAQAFALDRWALYNRLLIPAMSAGKFIFQERSFTTSLVYQPLMERISLQEVLQLKGNQVAMKYPPGLLIIPTAEPSSLVERYAQRKKVDNAIFERLDFQQKAQDVFLGRGKLGEDFTLIMRSLGTRIVYIENNPPKKPEAFTAEVIKTVEEYVELLEH